MTRTCHSNLRMNDSTQEEMIPPDHFSCLHNYYHCHPCSWSESNDTHDLVASYLFRDKKGKLEIITIGSDSESQGE